MIVFEDNGCGAFAALNLLRHTSELRWGTKTLLRAIYETAGAKGKASLWGRSELGKVSRDGLGILYNEPVGSSALLVNSRARPDRKLRELLSRKSPFAAVAGDTLVAARLNARGIEPGVLGPRQVKRISKKESRLTVDGTYLFGGYWELVESNGLAIVEQAKHFEDQLELQRSVKVKGPVLNVRVHGAAEVEDHVTFDARLGPVVVSEGAMVESFSRVSGPCFIGPRARIRSGLVRGGTSIFEECRVGGEVENSILMPHTNKAHLGYVGDSYVGEWVNLGASSTFSNLKNTYGNVRSEVDGKRVDTGMLKLGPVVGDMAKVSIGALVFAGRCVGTGSHVTGLVDTNVPAFTYFHGGTKRMVELFEDSVVETQRRMMERRGRTLSLGEEELIRIAFRATTGERRKAGVRKGQI